LLKYLASCVLLALPLTAGCGTVSLAGSGPDRTALAKTTIQTYWRDITHGKLPSAYSILTPGVRAGLSQSDFSQNFIGLLTRSGSLAVTVGKVYVNGDNATARVKLTSPRDQPLHAWQHLFWVNGGWHISDNNAYLSKNR
jgi:hypothetical protein